MRSVVEADREIPSVYWYEDPRNFPNSGVIFDASTISPPKAESGEEEPPFFKQVAAEDTFIKQVLDVLNGRDPQSTDPYFYQDMGHRHDMFGDPLPRQEK